jgi:pimeloyl-ACP methyl ester carboxylesterase
MEAVPPQLPLVEEILGPTWKKPLDTLHLEGFIKGGIPASWIYISYLFLPLQTNEKYGLRELPTHTYPQGKGLTLTTTRYQEVITFMKERPHPQKPGVDVEFFRDEPKIVFDMLPTIKPPVLYVFAGQSYASTPESIQRKMIRTRNGDVQMVTIQEAGHLIPQEQVDKCGILFVEMGYG